MQIDWTKHFKDQKEKEEFIDLLRLNRQILDRLSSILESKYQAVLKEEHKEISYENRDWPYLQAHRNGVKSAYMQIINLLDLK